MEGKKPAGILAALTLVATLLTGGVAGATVDPAPGVELRWALGAVAAEGESPTPVLKDSELASGTRLKFLVEPMSAGAVYLLLLDSQDRIHVLYRQPASQTADRAYVPAGRQWLELDDQPGRETFFILASADPLEDLERLLARYEASEDPERDELSDAIVREVRRLHKQHRRFARAVEKPVTIGGRTRAATDSESAIDQLAVEISAEKFYGKTITIDH